MSSIRYTKSSTGEFVYCIRVPDSDPQKKREIAKSYNQFCDLHKRLSEYIPQSQLPQLPPSGFSLFNSTKFHVQRATALQAYTDSLFDTPSACTCPVFHDFIGATTSSTKESDSTCALKEILRNSGLSRIAVPELPLDKASVLKDLSLSSAVGSANKLLIQLNAAHAKLSEASDASTALSALSASGLGGGFDAKASLLEGSAAAIGAALEGGALGGHADVAEYLRALVAAIGEGVAFVSALDVLNSVLLVQRMEDGEQRRANPNAKIADEYVPWYNAQADRLIPLLFSDAEKVRAEALEALRLLEAALARDAQTSLDLGDDAARAALEATRAEVARAVQCDGNGGSGGSSGGKTGKMSEEYFGSKAQQFEAAMFDLISRADAVDEVEDEGERESAASAYRSKILQMMRDLRQLRTDITKAMAAVEEDKTLDEDENERRRRVAGLRRTSERVEELQQNIGDFEEAWSRRVAIDQPAREARIREEQVSMVQKATLALEDDIYEL